MAPKSFVKSGTTRASVATSKAEFERMLRRYGADGLSTSQDYANWRIVVRFVVANSAAKGAHKVPVEVPIDVRRVYDALFGHPRHRYTSAPNPNGYEQAKLEQAERVAWRHLILLVDAALTAAASGVQTITESLFAHTMVVLESGKSARLADYLESEQGRLAPGIRGLLAAPAEVG